MADEETAERDPMMGGVLVIGQYRYGWGPMLADARKEFRRQRGQLSKPHAIYVFPPETEYRGVDKMGDLHWIGPSPIRIQ